MRDDDHAGGTSGVGGLSPVDLGKLLSGQIANASLSMGAYTHGVSGGSTPKDLETALAADVSVLHGCQPRS
jgi:hypothetical protein